jgi:hypothetical protein
MLTDRGQCLTPYLPTEEYLWPAWVSCFDWALGEAEIVAAFRAETGFAWTPGRTALDRMVDDACGMPEAFLTAFAGWMNDNIWGEQECNND